VTLLLLFIKFKPLDLQLDMLARIRLYSIAD
jgi:hypothetical protein